MVPRALDAAAVLADEAIEAEVIDLRTLVPLDLDTLLASAGKTGRLLIAHEAVMRGGVGAEIATTVLEHLGDRCSIRRIGAPATPVPASPELEAHYVPSADAIARSARQLAAVA
jgi:pyruvate dehydrogenase E1 component beta subunit